MLTNRLKTMAMDYDNVNSTKSFIDIRTQGSEIFIPEWENKIGVAFSSPPYFYLEDYKIGEQSYHEGVSYSDWKENYLKPTFKNINKYLVDNGFFILNINNFQKYKLVEDSIQIAQKTGFILFKEHILSNIKRTNSNGGFNNNSEKNLVFKKNNCIRVDEEEEKGMNFMGNIKNINVENEDLIVTLSTTNFSIEEKLQKIKDKELAITIKRKSQKRSLDANSYAWFLMEEIGKATNKSKDEVYIDMLGRYGVFTHIVVKPNVVERIEEEWRLVRNLGSVTINEKSGIQLQCYFGSSTYTREEMSRFIDGIITECKDLEIELLSDEEIKSMKGEWKK